MNSADGQQNQNAALQKQFEELRDQYQTSVQQNETSTGKIRVLTQENADLKKQVENVGQNQGNMSDLQASLNSASTRITELETQNQNVVTQNRTLSQKNEALTSDNQQLQSRVDTIGMELDKMKMQNQQAAEEKAAIDARVTALSTENENQASMLTERSEITPEPASTTEAAVTPEPATGAEVEVAKRDYRKSSPQPDAELIAENAKYSNLNAELENDNALLRAQISELQGDVDGLNLAADTKGSALASLTPAIDGSATGKYNVKYWIIPFLLIGLGVGLYTYFMEEHRGTGTVADENRQNV